MQSMHEADILSQSYQGEHDEMKQRLEVKGSNPQGLRCAQEVPQLRETVTGTLREDNRGRHSRPSSSITCLISSVTRQENNFCASPSHSVLGISCYASNMHAFGELWSEHDAQVDTDSDTVLK